MKQIERSRDLECIKIGSIIYKDTRERFNLLSNFYLYENKFIRYQVYQITADVFQLAIPDDEIIYPNLLVSDMTISGINNKPPVLNKTGFELYNEGVWWLESEMDVSFSVSDVIA